MIDKFDNMCLRILISLNKFAVVFKFDSSNKDTKIVSIAFVIALSYVLFDF